ncbi:aldose 1-epimerase family protein [Neobacillus sp. 179-C4.2 HS]|uniref:Aldose 1-epimerase family protein n=1 Tax=Neobacillus driksii TaxID=3035913 RepID=A0ABV4YZ02_9BACI|nr:aldose 1-epimerase family protein [Neobacillus sp. 179.-C4.2 HS]MDP5194661.1 aldose 1-epimerase family protein [Neobacillus sp. 179.-C4.2 HS]
MIVIENDWLKVDVLRHGAEVRKVMHKKNALDYMWTGDEAYWGRVSPVLFPIVGRLKEDHYELDGKTYKMSQHGFLRDVKFDVAEQTSTTVSFVFESLGRFVHVYPYEFKATIRYRLIEDSLIVQWQILNANKEEMYFSIGAHPAFRIPLVENETIEDYHLNFTPAANKNVMEYELRNSLIHEKGIVNNLSTIQLKNALFANDALIYSNIDRLALVSKQSSHGVEVIFQGFPFVGIWSKYIEPDGTIAPFVCIEPWYGIADTYDTTGNLKEKFGVNKLGAGETFQAEYIMKFK